MQTWKISGTDVAVLRGVVTLGLFAALAGAARLLQEMVIAWRFGLGEAVDTYYLLLSVLTWLPLVALSVGTSVLVPAELVLRQRKSTEAAHFRSEVLGATLLVALILGILAVLAVAARGHWPWLGARLSPSPAGELAAIALALLVPLGLVVALLSAWFVASQKHLGTLIEAVPSLALVLILVLTSAVSADALFWATAAAAALQVGVIACLLRDELPNARLSFTSSAWQQIRLAGAAMVIGQVLISATVPIDNFFAFTLVEGSVAVLNYANRLILGVLAVIGIAVQRAGLPILTGTYLISEATGRKAVVRWTIAALATGCALAAVAALIAEPVVRFVYERGSFSGLDTARVVSAFRVGLLQTPFYLGGMVFAIALAAQGRQAVLAAGGAIALIVKLLSNWALAGPLGANGIQLGTALMYMSTCTYLGFVVLRRPDLRHQID